MTEPKSENIKVRCTADEKDLITRAAAQQQRTVSDYLRLVAVAAARRVRNSIRQKSHDHT
jgi:uncharacterized protein (DUF1778 family)